MYSPNILVTFHILHLLVFSYFWGSNFFPYFIEGQMTKEFFSSNWHVPSLGGGDDAMMHLYCSKLLWTENLKTIFYLNY